MRIAMFALLVLCMGALLSPGVAFAEDPPDTAAAEVAPPAIPLAAVEVPDVAPPTTTATTESDSSPWSVLGFHVAEIVVDAVGAMIAIALGLLARWLTSKTSNEKLKAVIAQATDAVRTAVGAVQQTMVDTLKTAAENGKLTGEQQSAAFALALNATKAILGTKGLAALRSSLAFGQDQVNEWLTHKIEAEVQMQKPVTP